MSLSVLRCGALSAAACGFSSLERFFGLAGVRNWPASPLFYFRIFFWASCSLSAICLDVALTPSMIISGLSWMIRGGYSALAFFIFLTSASVTSLMPGGSIMLILDACRMVAWMNSFLLEIGALGLVVERFNLALEPSSICMSRVTVYSSALAITDG